MSAGNVVAGLIVGMGLAGCLWAVGRLVLHIEEKLDDWERRIADDEARVE